MNPPMLRQLVRFAVVGTLGFVIDGGLLYLLLQSQFDPYLARGISFPIAVTATWYLNRVWTFSIGDVAVSPREYKRYLLIQIAGAGANYAVYVLLLQFVEHTPANALMALAVGALVGLIINFFGARYWAFAAPLESSDALQAPDSPRK